jgi:NADH-quinone oxidoreductase subunit F
MMDLPLLIVRHCTGCADCLVVCPADCLEMAGAVPWLPRPLDCIACGLCAAACPVEAITMTNPVAA